jgi:hypothetical protein
MKGHLAAQVAGERALAIGHKPHLVRHGAVPGDDPAIFLTITVGEEGGEKIGVREPQNFRLMPESDGLQQGVVHPHEPPIGVFDEEIDVRQHVKQLAQGVFGGETREKGLLELHSLGIVSGPGGFVGHWHGNL